VTLSADPSRRTERALTAAQVSLHAGEFDVALRMLDAAEAGELAEAPLARAAVLRGQIAFASGHGADAPPMLLAAANRIRPVDPDLARETYLEAWGAALFAGELTTAGALFDAASAALELPPPEVPRASDLLRDALATVTLKGRSAAAPLLRRASAAFAAPDGPVEENFRWGWLATVPANLLWDEQAWDTINARQLALARGAGALAGCRSTSPPRRSSRPGGASSPAPPPRSPRPTPWSS
jgi:hypothetical protein